MIKANFEAVEKLVIAITNNDNIIYTKEYDLNKQKITAEEIDRDIFNTIKKVINGESEQKLNKEIDEIQHMYYIDNAVTHESDSDDEKYTIISVFEKIHKHENGHYYSESADTRLTKTLIGDILGDVESVEGDALYETQTTRLKEVLNRVSAVRVWIHSQSGEEIASTSYRIGEDVESLVDVDVEVNKLLNKYTHS